MNFLIPQKYLSLTLLLFLGILDALFTSFHLGEGAKELNPLLNLALEQWGIKGLLGVKFAITLPCCFILLRQIHLPFAQKGVDFLLGTYMLVALYHVWGLQSYLRI